MKTGLQLVGYNCQNVFLTLSRDRYTLFLHDPIFWTKKILNTSIPISIIPEVTHIIYRFFLDLCGKNLLNINIFKLLFFNIFEPGNQNLIINLCGNPKGAKFLLLSIIEKKIGSGFKVGRFNSLNSFQRKDLLTNARVISFSDANPKNLTKNSIDFLKSISGHDSIQVEKKMGEAFFIRPDALIIISNNENFEDIPAYKEDALSDRVLNLVVPFISENATVVGLGKFLEPELDWFFTAVGMTVNMDLMKRAVRAEKIDSVTGAGAEKLFFKFLKENFLYQEGNKVGGKSIYIPYQKHLTKFDKNAKIDSQKGFYQKVEFQLFKLLSKSIEQRRRLSSGVTFFNLGLNDSKKERIQDKISFS